jgi:hypothetical protein
MAVVTVLAFMSACGGGRVIEVDTADESGRRVELSPQEKLLAEAYVPGGKDLTEHDISQMLSRVRPVTIIPTVVLPVDPRRGRAPSDEELARLRIIERGKELACIDMRLRREGKLVPEGRLNIVGEIERAERSAVHIRNINGDLLTVDFVLTPGIDVSHLDGAGRVAGVFNRIHTPVGHLQGLVLSDTDGLLFAVETRLFERGLSDRDLDGFIVFQDADDIGEPVYDTPCSKLYYPLVAIFSGLNEPLIVENGQERIVRKGRKAYLITIVRSQHVEEVPCEVSFEEAPWQLEYVIRRIDDPAEAKKIEAAWKLEEPDVALLRFDPQEEPVAGDTPPDPKLKGDAPPRNRQTRQRQ